MDTKVIKINPRDIIYKNQVNFFWEKYKSLDKV